jgi:hypothetical protein
MYVAREFAVEGDLRLSCRIQWGRGKCQSVQASAHDQRTGFHDVGDGGDVLFHFRRRRQLGQGDIDQHAIDPYRSRTQHCDINVDIVR